MYCHICGKMLCDCRCNEQMKAQDAVWKHCKVIYWPKDGAYPLEHDFNAGKIMRNAILAEIEKDALAIGKEGRK